jgi:hypothetical protein
MLVADNVKISYLDVLLDSYSVCVFFLAKGSWDYMVSGSMKLILYKSTPHTTSTFISPTHTHTHILTLHRSNGTSKYETFSY